MEDDLKIEFLDDGRIVVTDKEFGDEAIFRSYDDDPELYLVALHCRSVGMSFSQLEYFHDVAQRELSVQEYLAQAEEPATRLASELAKLHEWNAEGRNLSETETFEFFHDQDIKLLRSSPADFFLPLDMERMTPDTVEESTGAQFFRRPEEAEEQIPAALRKQAEALYETKYSFRIGYPILLLEAPREEYVQTRLAVYPDSPSGILFLDRSHVYGIIQFSGLKRYFATFWNTRRGPQSPQLYCSESGKMLLVKKLALNENDELSDPNWYAFFNSWPNLVVRQHQEFLQEAETSRRPR